MRIGVLGTTTAADDSDTIPLGGPKQRALLGVLALHLGRAVAIDTITDLVWDGAPPPGAAGTLQGYVAGLRRALEPGRTTRGGGTLLVTEQPGYALRLDPADLDAAVFERAVTDAHTATAPLAAALLDEHPRTPPLDQEALLERHAVLAEAIGLWRATPYADLGDAPAVAAERSRLEELRLLALEDRAVLGLLLGRHAPLTAELDALTRHHPLRERLWALRALALAGAGRQAEALAVLSEVRTLLDDELGLEPGAELRAVQAQVLHQEAAPVAAPARVTAPAAPAAAAAPVAPWPLVGRDAELGTLTDLLDRTLARAGISYATLTGDPGIGKTRLTTELAAYATAHGVQVVVGRCSQDDGAPALYPWVSVLGELGAEVPTATGEDDGGAAFRAWQRIVDTVQAAAERQPLLLVLDDLHWADTSTLRLLRLLAEAEAAPAARLLVLTTWREHPLPTGPLADVVETLARRHAVRLRLRGLAAPDAARIVGEVAASEPTPGEAEALTRRTDGNPFFLVEYARLARERGDLGALVAEADPPAAVHDVVARRLDRLSPASLDLVRHASVLGRVFEVELLAATTGSTEDAVLNGLDPALEAGLVTEDGVDRFRFTHALVRDTALATLPHSRRARVHARAASALSDRRGRESEIARHWLAAGPRHQSEAWRAAAAAGRAAAGVHAYVEALEMLELALRGQDQDPGSTSRERFDVLVVLADVLRAAGRWLELRDVAHEALEVADQAGDLDLLVQAGTMTGTGALWLPSAHGQVDQVLCAALRRTLAALPPGDDPRRCRAMLALAGESYYGATPAEREALAEQAVAMAERLGERELLVWARLHAALAIWRADTAGQRRDLGSGAADLARELGDPVSEAAGLTVRAIAEGELGLIAEMTETCGRARELAGRTKHLYAQLVLDSLEAPWLAMRGRFDEVEALIADMTRIGELVSITGSEEAIAASITSHLLWTERYDELVAAAAMLEASTWLPVATTIAAIYCRAGRADEARTYLAEHAAGVERALAEETWFSPMGRGLAGEAALHVGDPALGSRAYGLLAHLSGRPLVAGSGSAMGPIDTFLAMAAASTGERDLATRHADRAAELCETWEIPLAAQWLRRERDRWGF
ncbi:MAG TPA: BTAD domain-containing putative transcriptional regulator [Nocardioides sp.]|uniref:BTAD domain-containing putative transcriptional regulator n=1 Tax=Nocardioides sp. TaxID=35761 RepID=UPI002CE44F2A|nr:BTAD domain-containing putative transcriptional regulator [Nocardioides sp.]HTW14706.1 BTAD domain-containing putative transcriptional regulator [Nocardioides sp.]